VEVLHVEYLNRHFDVTTLVRGDRGARIANSGLHVGDRTRDARDHAGTVFSDRQKLHRVSRFLRPPRPFNVHDSLAIDHQLHHVLAARRMYGHALAARDIADDLFAVQRIAAARARHHQIVDAAYDDRVVTQTNETLDRTDTASESRLFLLVELLKLFRSKILRDDISRYELSVTNTRQQIVDAAVTIVTRNPLHVLVIVAQQLPGRELKTRCFLFEKFAPDLDRLRALLFRHPVTHAIARARGNDEVQPVARRM